MLHVTLAATVRDGADGLLDLGMDPVRASSQPLVPQGHSPPSGRTASDLGVPLRLLGDRQRPLLGADGASGPIAPIRGLVEAPVPDPLLRSRRSTYAMVRPQILGRKLGRTTDLHPARHTSRTQPGDSR